MGNAGPRTCLRCGAEDLEGEAPGEVPTTLDPDDGSPVSPASPSSSGPSSPGKSDRRAEVALKSVLPSDGNLTVMMFGMTGSGKSSLGNLIAGKEVFVASDDTSSVTNQDSVMRYAADDGSLVLLDTIGLGDTEISQEEVIASIRDVAVSAPCGIDVILFVLRFGRITDDTIARMIYLTDFLWGRECLPNLYTVVTGASRLLNKPAEASEWIEQQAQSNWRFKHIYDLVGNDPRRFIFIDNPDPLSQEPHIEERQAASRSVVLEALVAHPLAGIVPFSHASMRKARELSEAEVRELELRRREVQELEMIDDRSSSSSSASTSDGSKNDPNTSLKKEQDRRAAKAQKKVNEMRALGKTIVELCELRAQAIEKRGVAEKNLQKRLRELKRDPAFEAYVAEQAKRATVKFVESFDDGTLNLVSVSTDPGAKSAHTSVIFKTNTGGTFGVSAGLLTACRSLVGTLTKKVGNLALGSIALSAPLAPAKAPAKAPARAAASTTAKPAAVAAKSVAVAAKPAAAAAAVSSSSLGSGNSARTGGT
eukprot:CAMPEP_0177320810 /NCGR_PEP_ID=MMETSP0368-20130122/15335_1 /TAXON_ID=447022 ORGANISM="Scrippsiella hangoei-like, Strain SHHI-4" /NCGR_SAMPLE_ID=MMETSP0368 /ASSEMBLY_ACC=CAM_ASM_000363 /LENGTH=536 /DNA_ID=CAMNT_0018780389 /DNA_START=47 /DNA_END=1654 /DNA_ORIENTATION=+